MTWIVFFDGQCGLCTFTVQFLANVDEHEHLKFAPLEGQTAAELGFAHYADLDDGSVVVCRESDGRSYVRSDAVIELGHALGGIWRLLYLGHFIPKFAREALYRLIAKNRMRWFGHVQDCTLADSAVLSRMLP
jgi:predicted DCC family thiol-disulfide oxidoreductase YuxK